MEKKNRRNKQERRRNAKDQKRAKQRKTVITVFLMNTGPKEIENLIPLVREKWYSLIINNKAMPLI
jgi:hypothetical protein